LFTLFAVVLMFTKLFSLSHLLLRRESPFTIKKHFSTFNNSIRQFKQWLVDNNCSVFFVNTPAIGINLFPVKAVKKSFSECLYCLHVALDAVVSDMFGKSASSKMQERQKEKAIKQAMKLLVSEGTIKDTDIKDTDIIVA